MSSSTPGAAAIQRRLFRLAESEWRPLAATAALHLAGGLLAIAVMLTASRAILSVFPGGEGGQASGALRLLVLLIVSRAAVTAVGEWSAQRFATRVKSRLRLDVIERLVARGPFGAVEQQTGDVTTAVVDGIDKLDAFYRRFVPQVLATGIVPVAVLAAVAWLDPMSAVVLGLTAPLIPVFMWLLGTLAERRAREQWIAMGRLGGQFLDTVQGLETLHLFGRAAQAAEGVARASEALGRQTLSVLRVAFLSGFVLELAASVSTAVLAALVGVRLLQGTLGFDAGLPVLLLAPEFYLPFRQLGQRHHAAMEGTAAGQQILELLDGATAASGKPYNVGPTLLRGNGDLSVTDLSYRYPSATRDALRHVTFSIAPQTLTAIVGPSGSGKSTLLALLLRFVDPASGSMRLNGCDARLVDPASWRTGIAYVPQRPTFVYGTVRENLMLGAPSASAGQVEAAARLAGAHAFIQRLPDGYDTVLDETATSISGGERQRLALARALVKPAPLLVLDEPTASVDEITESAIARALGRISRERTVLVVAHRPNTVKHADTVLVFDRGRIVETRTRGIA